jgi:autotransporter-associated beta strand protein
MRAKHMKTVSSRVCMYSTIPKTIVTTLFSVALSAFAQDTWTGNDSANNANWSDALNWSDAANAAPSPFDALNFAGGNVNNNNDFPNGTAFDGINFNSGGPFNLAGNSVLLSGNAVGNYTGVYNASGGYQSVSLNLGMDWGYYTFVEYGGGLGLNGALTASNGSVAMFYGSISSTSLTTDSAGLISGLGGQGLMFPGNYPFNLAAPSGLATVSAGAITAYTGFTQAASGAIASGANNNIELTASGAATAFSDSSATVNTITADQAGNSGGTATDTLTTTGTLTLGQHGGIYALNGGGNKNLLTVTGGSLTAGTASGAAIVLGANGSTPGSSPPNMMTMSSIIKDNPAGSVSVVKVGSGSINYGSVTNTYSGGTYLLQGQLQAGNSQNFGTGPVYVGAGATAWLLATGTFSNNFFLSPGTGSALWNSTAINPGALMLTSGTANETLNGTITLLGGTVSAPNAGCRLTGDKDTTITYFLNGPIVGTGTLDLNSGPHATVITMQNGSSTNSSYTGGLIIEESLSNPSSARTIQVNLGAAAHPQIPHGAGAGNVTLYSAANSGSFINGSTVTWNLAGISATINGLNGSAAGNTANLIVESTTGTPTLTLGDGNASGNYAGNIAQAAGTLSLAKIGTGTQTFSGTLSHHGSTTVNAGTIALTQSCTIASSTPITVAAGATLDVSQLNDGLTVAASQTLNCVGTVNGNVTVNGAIEALDAIGTFTNTGSMTLSPASVYDWNINDAMGAAGSDPGWTMLDITGSLQINATAGNPITLNVSSLTAGDVPGAIANFSGGSSYSWVIAQAAGGISGFTGTAQFNIVTSSFTNDPNSSSQWSVTQSNNALVLNFSGFQVITTPVTPVTENVNQGHTASFTVTANAAGSGTTFAWYQNGNPLSNGGQSAGGAPGNVTIVNSGNVSTLTIAGVDSAQENADSGLITVTVNTTSGGPQMANSSATLNVIDYPYNPNVSGSQSTAPVTAGSVNILTATAGGTGPFSYQWQLNGANIAGATGSSYTVDISQITTGNYTVEVSNPAGSVTSGVTTESGPISVVPNQILFEPFNYADQVHPSSPPDPAWSAFGVTNLFNQATGVPVVWQNVGNNDFNTMPAYNMADQYAPPRNLATDEYPVEGLAGNDANVIYADSDVNGGQVNLPFGPGGTITNGSLYFSTVVQLYGMANTAVMDYVCGFGTGATNSTTHSMGLYVEVFPNEVPAYPNVPYALGVFKGNLSTAQLSPGVNGAWSANQLDYTVLFVVGRININAAGPGFSTCDLWINPPASSFYASEASLPTPDIANAGGTAPDQTGGISLFYMKITTWPVDRYFGDVRVGTTWASVTPPSAPTLSLANQVLTNTTSSTVVFASANAGNPVNSYQWTFDSGSGPVTLSDTTLGDGAVVTGSSTPTLTISGATVAELGTYTVTGNNNDPAPSAGGATLTGSASAVLTTVRPSLAISGNSSSAVLSWPTNWPVSLVMTTNLTPPINWVPAPNGQSSFVDWPVGSGELAAAPSSIPVVGTNYNATVTAGGTNALYFELAPVH